MIVIYIYSIGLKIRKDMESGTFSPGDHVIHYFSMLSFDVFCIFSLKTTFFFSRARIFFIVFFKENAMHGENLFHHPPPHPP